VKGPWARETGKEDGEGPVSDSGWTCLPNCLGSGEAVVSESWLPSGRRVIAIHRG
jgi:hypothetical protein